MFDHTENKSQPNMGLSALYLFLTDQSYFYEIAEILTSWIENEDEELVKPWSEKHAKVLRGLLVNAEQTPQRHNCQSFPSMTALLAQFGNHIMADDVVRLRNAATPRAPKSGAIAIRLYNNAFDTFNFATVSIDRAQSAVHLTTSDNQFEAHAAQKMASSFKLTGAEIKLVTALVQGGTLRKIAKKQNKSLETLRSQVKSITSKLGVKSQADVIRFSMQISELTTGANIGDGSKLTRIDPSAAPYKTITRDGRNITYQVFGKPEHPTLLYVHPAFSSSHWPKMAIELALEQNRYLILVARAGYGASDVNPKQGKQLLEDHAYDLRAVLEREVCQDVSIYCEREGLAVAAALNHICPQRLSQVTCLDPLQPIITRQDIDQLSGIYRTLGFATLFAPSLIEILVKMGIQRSANPGSAISADDQMLTQILASKTDEAEHLRCKLNNYAEMTLNNAEGVWRDLSWVGVNWLDDLPTNALTPSIHIIASANNPVISQSSMQNLAQRLGADHTVIADRKPAILAGLQAMMQPVTPIQSANADIINPNECFVVS